MKYRLEANHYSDDVELEAGTEVGDGCADPWRYSQFSDNVALRGQSKPPSASMTPLDDEARAAFNKYFGKEAPERDPTKKIPILGTDPNQTGTKAPHTTNFTGRPQLPPPQRPINPVAANPVPAKET